MIKPEPYKEFIHPTSLSGLTPELLFEILKSPRHFQYAKHNGPIETPEQKLKRYLDCYLFEGIKAFADQYIETNKQPKDFGEYLTKEIIPIKVYDQLQKLIESFRQNKTLGEILFQRMNCQNSYYTTINNVPLKCRIQSFSHEKRSKFFLNTYVVKSALPKVVKAELYEQLSFDYAFIKRVMQNITGDDVEDYNYYFVLIESEAPYSTIIYKANSIAFMSEANFHFEIACEQYLKFINKTVEELEIVQ